MRKIVWLGMIVLLAGCTSTNYYTQTIQSWRGANVNTLVKHWGSPDDLTTAPNGQSMYVYKTISYSHANQPIGPAIGVSTSRTGAPEITTQNPSTNNTWNRGMSISCVVAFTANNSGTIVDTKITGRNCYAGQTFARRMSNPAKPVNLVK